MVVLGIDPGTVKMGWAVMRHDGGHVTLLECGCFKEKASKSMPQRLAGMYRNLCSIMVQYSPDLVCLEKAFVGENPASALSLGCVRGVVMIASEMHEATLQERSPNTAKKGLTGFGNATKEDVMCTVHRFFGRRANEDAADAVALAFSADLLSLNG